MRDLPGYVELLGACLLGQDDPVLVRLADDTRQVGMRQGVAEGELAVEVLLVLAVGRLEGDDDVGVVALGADEPLRVGLAPVELGQNLVGRVAPARAVPLHLPVAPQLLGRVEVDADVEVLGELAGVEAEQPFTDEEAPRDEVVRRPEGAVGVLVDGLHDRLLAAQMHEVLAEDVEVVAVGVERRDVALGPLPPVVPVVVVGAEVGDLVLAEDADEATSDRRLTGTGVADDAEHDGTRHLADPSHVRNPNRSRS